MTAGLFRLVWMMLLIHAFAAFLATIEIIDDFLAPKPRKALWLAGVWLLPVIGIMLVHRKNGTRWGSGRDTGGGDTSIGGGPGADHGGYGCGDGGGDCG